MNTMEARMLATSLMEKHGLYDVGWSFRWTQHKRICGRCWIPCKVIDISEPIVKANGPELVQEIILHEIAHALSGRRDHGPEWMKVAIDIGCKATGRNVQVVQPPGKWPFKCGSCGMVYYKYRKVSPYRSFSCIKCGGKKYNPKFKMVEVVA